MQAQQVDISAVDAEAFSEYELVHGKDLTEDECVRLPNAVWVSHRLGVECIRYYVSGGLPAPGSSDAATTAVIYFHGDRLAGSQPLGHYDKVTPAALVKELEFYHRRFKVPFILVARPGVFGSSGEHKQRRRMKESYSLDAAVDAIKKRYGLGQLVIAGQSGGAYTTAALLTLGRSDIKCAVASSGVYAVAELAEIKRAKSNLRPKPGCDVTNYCDQYEVIDHVDGIVADPQRMIYFVANPYDANTVFALQKRFADKVAAAGHRVEMILAKGKGPDGHSLSHASYRVAGACAAGTDVNAALADVERY
jgi:pimeloyl-ACP methyl ester carboxylesterase